MNFAPPTEKRGPETAEPVYYTSKSTTVRVTNISSEATTTVTKVVLDNN